MHSNGGAAQLGPLALAVPLVVALLLLSLGPRLSRRIIDGVAAAASAAVLGLDAALFAETSDGRVISWLGGWTPHRGQSVGIVLVVDRLGAGIALLAAVLMTAAFVFTWRYFESIEAHFHALMLLFLVGMTGFALTGDLFDMFVFFELMGAVAYALTGFKVEDRTALQGALNFGIVNSLGAYFTLTGIALLYARTGQLGLAQVGVSLHGHRVDALVAVAFVFVATGWLVKAAAVPFHFWLDDAHAVAPSPVCVLFSGVMVELGIYGVFRVYWATFADVLPSDDIRRAFLILGALTAVIGTIMCLAQRHLKRLLAFSTIAHVGLFISAAATLDASGTSGAALYIAGHAGAKSALFLLAGVVLNRYGSVDEVTLHGRGRDAKVTAVLFAVAALALAGLPPFGTALGKAIGEDALYKSGYWFGPVLFVAVSALTAGAVLRAGARIFVGLGPKPPEGEPQTTGDGEERETEHRLDTLPVSMGTSIVVLIMGCLAVGVIPGVRDATGAGATQFLDRPGYVAQALHGAAAAHAVVPKEVAWTLSGIGLSVLSVALSVVVAAVGIYGPAYQARFRAFLRPVALPLAGLRRLHSGHVGDYVTWLFLGVGALAALIGLPLVN